MKTNDGQNNEIKVTETKMPRKNEISMRSHSGICTIKTCANKKAGFIKLNVLVTAN